MNEESNYSLKSLNKTNFVIIIIIISIIIAVILICVA